jgi:hypothetical protein
VRKTQAKARATFTPSPKEGLMESIPVTGIVIDYDYARKIGTSMEKTSVRPRYSLYCSVLIFILGYPAFHAAFLSGERKS